MPLRCLPTLCPPPRRLAASASSASIENPAIATMKKNSFFMMPPRSASKGADGRLYPRPACRPGTVPGARSPVQESLREDRPLRSKPSGFRALADELQHVPVVLDPLVADPVATVALVDMARRALAADDAADLRSVPIDFLDFFFPQEPIRVP